MPKHAVSENDVHHVTTIELDETVPNSTALPSALKGQQPDSPTIPSSSPPWNSRRNRLSLRQRLELPRSYFFSKSSRRSYSGDSGSRTNRPCTASTTPPSPALKPPLESQESQLACYHSLQSSGFASRHEELQHLRLACKYAQRTLLLRNEEIQRLQKEAAEHTSEIARLQGFVGTLKKRHLHAPLSDGYRGMEKGTDIGIGELENSSPRKIVLELRQNVAMRDTVIDGLRRDLTTLRDERQKVTEELNRAAAELLTKDDRIKELQRFATQKEGNKSVNATCAALSCELDKSRQRCSAADAVISDLHTQLRRIEDGSLSTTTASSAMHQTQSPHGLVKEKPAKEKPVQPMEPNSEADKLRRELSETRRALDRERESSGEAERQWRSELARLHGSIATASFADARLQAAQQENDSLQQRVRELRDEAVGGASREYEMRAELRALREAHERHEDEVAALQRRLDKSHETERTLRDDVDTLERQLTRVQKGEGVAAQDSYAALMALHTAQQERLTELEEQLRRANAVEKSDLTNTAQAQGAGTHAADGDASGVRRSPNDATAKQVRVLPPAAGAGSEARSGKEMDVSSVAMVDGSFGPLMDEGFSASASIHCVSDNALSDPTESVEWRRKGVRERLQEGPQDTGEHQAQKVKKKERDVRSHEERDQLFLAQELERTRHELSAREKDLRAARQQIEALEGLTRGVGQRKVSSLRAARAEAAQWRRMVEERDVELFACEVRRKAEDDAIESALRTEMTRVEEEMDALRRERDSWRAAASVLNK